MPKRRPTEHVHEFTEDVFRQLDLSRGTWLERVSWPCSCGEFGLMEMTDGKRVTAYFRLARTAAA